MINSRKKGFTLVELVIVIAVVAVLAAVLIPTFSNLIKKANESSDIQAVRNINTFLTTANITDDVESILDVYEVFESSGYDVENYNPLYKGRTFYYDTELKQVLYVDNETGKVLFPAEYKDMSSTGRDWLTLGMEIAYEKITPSNASTETLDIYEVNNANQYAYLAEKLEKTTVWKEKVIIEIANDIDFKGAYVAINNVPAGTTLVIKAKSGTVSMKNITASEVIQENKDGRQYLAAGLVAVVQSGSSVEISNITFENINVKNTNAGNVSLLIGAHYGSNGEGCIKLTNVTIKNSTVIGHRSVGAIVGMLYSDIQLTNVTLENVNVQTVAGRSGLLFGFVSMSPLNNKTGSALDAVLDYTAINSTLSIYENEQNAGGIKDYTGSVSGANAEKEIHSYSIDGNDKEYRDYGFHKDALYCKYHSTNTYFLFELAK